MLCHAGFVVASLLGAFCAILTPIVSTGLVGLLSHSLLSSDTDIKRLDNAELCSSNIQRIHIRRQSRERFLCAVGSDQCIDLHCLDIVQLLQRLLNLPLVRLDVHNEHECVVLLDLLHRRLGVERVNDDLVVVEAWLMRD